MIGEDVKRRRMSVRKMGEKTVRLLPRLVLYQALHSRAQCARAAVHVLLQQATNFHCTRESVFQLEICEKI